MAVMSDRWIRRAAQSGMIEPFEPGQVRTQTSERIVSYGTSSYGYDVRCADEFKIFTNINSTIVIQKPLMKRVLYHFGGLCVLFHPTPLPWRVPSSIFAFHVIF